ncbi:Protein NLRC3 [Durusdinium trenchii]|uniref:Protein NLRC3 n=1 Tax=Durusdinium trenchii TaxID=1381693 RepID=A0ABP0QJP2_9DINO
MRHSADFQTQELYEFTEAHLEKLGVSIVEVERFAIWQADALEAMGRSRPVPGPEVDPASETLGCSPSWHGQTQTLTMDFASRDDLEAPLVADELQNLQKDHGSLILMGEGYGKFDSAGKSILLDKLKDVAERWQVYLARLRLMGEPEPPFMDSSRKLLQRWGIGASDAQALLGATLTEWHQKRLDF